MEQDGRIIVVAAPSGAGKDTVCKCLADKYSNIVIAPSTTTRKRRSDDNQLGGKVYNFVSEKEFKEMIGQGVFLEYSRFSENYYGTKIKDIQELIKNSKNVIMILDVNGGLEIKRIFTETALIFLKPPSLEKLKERLVSRGSDEPNEVEKRLKQVDYEYEMSQYFDYIVINDRLEDTVREVADIIFKRNEYSNGK